MRRQRHHTIESEPEEHVKDAIIRVLADNNNAPKMTVARVVGAGMHQLVLHFALLQGIPSTKR